MYHFLRRYLPAKMAMLITALAYAILVLLIILKVDAIDGGFRYLQV